MSKVGIKTYRLDKFPVNAKLTNQGDRIKRFELTYNVIDQIYSKLLHEIRNVYNDENDRWTNFKLYWKDEENDLISITNDSDFQSALENTKSGEILKIYILDVPMEYNQSKNESSNGENNSKKHQKHPGITCKACNSNIYGLRYKCKNCFDYSICEDCKKKKVHFNSHSFEIIESKYGFLTCMGCQNEMPNSFSVCKDCPNRNMLGIYSVCGECKEKNHHDHSCITIKTLDLERKRQKLLDDLENQMNKNEETKIHYGIQCFGCKRDGVSYRSTSFKCEHICLCIDCFIQGAFKNMVSISVLNSEDAEIQRKQNMFIPNMMNAFNIDINHQAIHQATVDMISSIGAVAASMANNGTSANIHNETGTSNNRNNGTWASGNGFHGAWSSNGPNGPRAGFF